MRRCAYILPLSLCVRLCVCVPATRSTFYFPSNKSIFRTTKNENEKRTSSAEVDASIERGFQELRLASKSRSWVAGRLALGSGIREWGPGGNSWRTWAERKLKSLNQKIPKNTMDAE